MPAAAETQAIVSARAGEARASSRDVAKAFEKNHRDVLRSIDNLIDQEPSLTPAQFCAGVALTPATGRQEHRCFEMNRDGFMLLAMGFTGPKALRLKLAWIGEFNRMEALLRAANDETDEPELRLPVAPDEFERTRMKLQMVREARIAFGPAAARRMWLLAELPDVRDPEHGALLPSAMAHDPCGSVALWMDARLEAAPGHRVGTMGLYEDYDRWCGGARGYEPLTVTAFGRHLTERGLPARRGARQRFRFGIRLKPD